MNFAYDIKSQLDTATVFEFYGFKPNRAGFVACPFHNEKTASMKIYEGDKGYYCFGCQASGDIITFVQEYFGMPFADALAKLNNDFCLGLPIGEKLNARTRFELEQKAFRRRQEIEKQKQEHQRLLDNYHNALDEYAKLDLQRIQYAPAGMEIDDKYIEVLTKIDCTKYRLDEAERELWIYEHQND